MPEEAPTRSFQGKFMKYCIICAYRPGAVAGFSTMRSRDRQINSMIELRRRASRSSDFIVVSLAQEIGLAPRERG
jgi:hypothetical protein